MTAAINKGRLNNFASQIWKSAERLRGKFKAYEYQSVIMPTCGESIEPLPREGKRCDIFEIVTLSATGIII